MRTRISYPPTSRSSTSSVRPLRLPRFPIFFFTYPAPTEIYTLSLHDALPIFHRAASTIIGADEASSLLFSTSTWRTARSSRSEEHTSELQSPDHLVCRLLLEKKKKNTSLKTTPLRHRTPNRDPPTRRGRRQSP